MSTSCLSRVRDRYINRAAVRWVTMLLSNENRFNASVRFSMSRHSIVFYLYIQSKQVACESENMCTPFLPFRSPSIIDDRRLTFFCFSNSFSMSFIHSKITIAITIGSLRKETGSQTSIKTRHKVDMGEPFTSVSRSP